MKMSVGNMDCESVVFTMHGSHADYGEALCLVRVQTCGICATTL